jgi:hypothetical protein
VFHYTLDHRLDREGFFADALVELGAEPHATTIFTIHTLSSNDWTELADEKICVVHKFFIRGPQQSSFTLLASLHWSLSLDVKNIDLLHRRKIYHPIVADHHSGKLLFLPTFEPAVEFDLDGHRLVIWEELPVWLTFDPRIGSGIPKPPVVFKITS